jgi:NIMA (never in mitosis gene a)-related kinase
LLTHPHLQPYIIKIHLKLNSPRRNTFPVQWSDSNYIKRTRFVEPETISIHSVKEKRRSFSNDRTLNPSISGTEQDSLCSSQRAQDFPSLNQKFTELYVGCLNKEYDIDKSITTKFSSAVKTPRLTPRKVSATPRRQTTPSKISHTGSKRDSVSIYTSVVNVASQVLYFSYSWWLMEQYVLPGLLMFYTISYNFPTGKNIEPGTLSTIWLANKG